MRIREEVVLFIVFSWKREENRGLRFEIYASKEWHCICCSATLPISLERAMTKTMNNFSHPYQ